MKTLISWKLFSILLIASIAANIAVLPYVFSLDVVRVEELPVSLPVAVLIQVTQVTVFFAVAVFFGLLLGKKTATAKNTVTCVTCINTATGNDTGSSSTRTTFSGKTKEGIGIGASEEEIVAAYGPPDRTSTGSKGVIQNLHYEKLCAKFSLKEGKLMTMSLEAPK